MLLKVVNLLGAESVVDVEPSDKVIVIKEKLEEKEGIPPEQQRLIHQGKQLKDDRTIDSYKLKGGTILHLVIALRGEVYQTWLQLRFDYLAVAPEIQNLLVKLRQHYFVGLITNGTSRAQWEKVERLHLQAFFDIILVSGDLPWEKPSHKIFHEACKYLGVLPEQCIMVGDKLETDILGGISANLGGTVWVPLSSSSSAEVDLSAHPSPDYVIKQVTELPTLLPKNPKVPTFRKHSNRLSQSFRTNKRFSLPDLDDSNSNSSDGS